MSKPNPNGIRREQLPVPFVYKSMAVVEEQHPSQQEQPHRHDYFSIIFVRSAKGIHHIDFKEYPLQEDTCYFLSPEQIHHMVLEGPPDGHVLLFTPNFLQQYSIQPQKLIGMELFFNCDEAPPLPIPKDQIAQLLSIIQAIQQEYERQDFNFEPLLGAYLSSLLLHLQRIKKVSLNLSSGTISRKASIVRQFKNDLELNYCQLHKVGEYAQLQNLSSIYLNEVIKGETGTSAKDYILSRIILEAKRLALFSDWNMKEIAFHLGFEDSAHFSKVFKKAEKTTFSAFRDQN